MILNKTRALPHDLIVIGRWCVSIGGLIRTVKIEHLDSAFIASEGISVYDYIRPVGNSLDIRHKLCVHF